MDERARDPHESGVPDASARQRLADLLDDLHEQVQRLRSAQGRMDTLLEAVMAVGSDLDLGVVLRRIVQSAVTLVDARYGALGVLGDDGTIKQFLTVGIDEEAVARIGHYPRGEGILGLLIRHPEPLRLADLAQHPASAGFPPGHPPMTSFLGAPIRVREQVFGNLYLTDKQGGAHFDAEDETVLRTLAAAAGVAIDNARLYDDARRRQRWLAASNELTRSLLSGAGPTDVLESFTGTVREMADADLTTVAVPVSGSGELVVEAASGAQAAKVRGLVLSASAPAAKVFASGETITGDAVGAEAGTGGVADAVALGPSFLVPLGTREHVRGVLRVARMPGGAPFTDAVVDMVIGYGNQAALALEVAEHRRDAERMLVLHDRDRIARDLHDLVIQRLFATGLQLQGMQRTLDGPAQARIARAVEDLDATIHDLRSAIFELHRQDSVSLRNAISAIVDEYVEALGFRPRLVTSGPVDSVVPDHVRPQLLAALREALSNVVRHAQASHVEVALTATGVEASLRIADDGVGIGATNRRSGLRNLSDRAATVDGALDLRANEPHGTILELRFPV